MWQYLADTEPIAVIAIVGGFIVALVAIISASAVNIYRLRSDAMLTEQLLDQGLTPDDVAKILRARKTRDAEEQEED